MCYSHWSSQGGINGTCCEDLGSDATKTTYTLHTFDLRPERASLSGFFIFSRRPGWTSTEPTLSYLFFFATALVSPVCHIASIILMVPLVLISPSWRCVCVCVFIKLHITAQSGPVILAILCHSHDPPKGGSIILITRVRVCVCMCIY